MKLLTTAVWSSSLTQSATSGSRDGADFSAQHKVEEDAMLASFCREVEIDVGKGLSGSVKSEEVAYGISRRCMMQVRVIAILQYSTHHW